MAERRDIPSFSGGDRVDWNLRQVPRLPHHGWHQARRASPPEKSFWKHDLHEKWRSKSSSRTIVEKRRLLNINKCADVPSTRTRWRYPSYSDAYEDTTAQHIGSYNSTKFGMAQPQLANVLLDTDFILFFVMVTKLDMVELSTLGHFSTVARVATRRMARPKVVGKMVSEDNKGFMFTLASGNWCWQILFQLLPKLPWVLKFLCSLAHSSATLFF